MSGVAGEADTSGTGRAPAERRATLWRAGGPWPILLVVTLVVTGSAGGWATGTDEYRAKMRSEPTPARLLCAAYARLVGQVARQTSTSIFDGRIHGAPRAASRDVAIVGRGAGGVDWGVRRWARSGLIDLPPPVQGV